MPSFSKQSLMNLSNAHPLLQDLFNEVIKHYDCSIRESYRDKFNQDAAVASGHSLTPWPHSKHNHLPSLAVDVYPYPVGPIIDSKEYRDRMHHFAGYVQGVAKMLNIPIRWGGDWDGDFTFTDQQLHDLPHFELEE